jgi:hypothetical protein
LTKLVIAFPRESNLTFFSGANPMNHCDLSWGRSLICCRPLLLLIKAQKRIENRSK